VDHSITTAFLDGSGSGGRRYGSVWKDGPRHSSRAVDHSFVGMKRNRSVCEVKLQPSLAASIC